MNLFRTSDDIDTLRRDLRAVQRDLRDLTRDLGHLSGQAWRARGVAGDWLQRQTGVDLSPRGRERALAQLRAQGGRSAAAMRSTVQEHPMGTVLGALAVGFVLVWMMTRSSDTR